GHTATELDNVHVADVRSETAVAQPRGRAALGQLEHHQGEYATPEVATTMTDRDLFAAHGFVNLGKLLDDEDVVRFVALFDDDRRRYPNFWRPFGAQQEANYDALVSSPEVDGLIRHPRILPHVEELMGGAVCFSEIGLRLMPAYEGAVHQYWHRDRLHWPE